jgi:hypothetical protein
VVALQTEVANGGFGEELQDCPALGYQLPAVLRSEGSELKTARNKLQDFEMDSLKAELALQIAIVSR